MLICKKYEIKNKKLLLRIWFISLPSILIVSLLSACGFNKSKCKLEVLDYFFTTKNNDYYIAYQFDHLNINNKTNLEKILFSTSVINHLNQRVSFNIDLKPIIINNRIYIRLPQRPQPKQTIIINSSDKFVPVKVIKTSEMATEFIEFNQNDIKPIKVVNQSAWFSDIKKQRVQFQIKLLNVRVDDANLKNIDIELWQTRKQKNI
ncbi:putative lipoprotein [Ureaplasma urealyticum serovar 2 str. ATCC 27814]|uniref:MBA family surface membrane protein n=1 Tax=Ureaplasma urealyticum TaxID=2130 RepID=UPI0001981E3C|nr:hypothetical protein [Ureaplasma urealyticum]EEH01936.1 putative lipoprotein [Ureaplasma urealyticum serovar 2 str. ATCC 27814]